MAILKCKCGCDEKISMHCDGHRYKNLERIFWTTCCEFGCHKDLEKLGRL